MKKFYTALTILVLGSLLIAACDSIVGLGPAINMLGPVVTISGPSRRASETDPIVNSLFNLSGTVQSESRIALMTVTLDFWNPNNNQLTRMGREWKWENGWKKREFNNDEWKEYTESDYASDVDPANPVSPPSPNGSSITAWNLPVNMKHMEGGEYFITVSAWDSAGKHDSNSIAKLKIKHNNKEPNLKIITPVLQPSKEGEKLSYPKMPDYSGYIYDPFNRPEDTYKNIDYFTNNIEEFTWEIDVPEGMSFEEGFKFSFEITDEYDLDNPDPNRNIYKSWSWDEVNGPLPQYGIFKDHVTFGSLINNRYKVVGGEIKIDNSLTNGQDKITPMQIVTTVEDTALNVEYRSKGWLLYLPDSDFAYSDITFAYMERLPEEVPVTAFDNFTMNRNSVSRNNVAYDDDGVQRVNWKLYKLQDGSLEVQGEPFPGSWPTNGNFTSSSKRQNWEFTAESRFGIGRFRIDVTVTDIHGIPGYTQSAYFSIVSNSTPTIKEFANIYDDPLWGDPNGNFQIKGTAQIEDSDIPNDPNHGVKVDRILVAWIKPNLGYENDLRYQQANDPLWPLWGSSLPSGGITDSYGNKVWEVPSTDIVFDATTDGNKGKNTQEEYNFELNLNLFEDLHIGNGAGETPFIDQVFRVKVISKTPTTEFSSVDQLTTLGEDEEPTVKITDIYIMNADGVETPYSFSSGFGMLPAIYENFQVKLAGTWSENSIVKWNSSGKSHTQLTKDFNVRWESEKEPFDFSILLENFTSGGNWSTEYKTFTQKNSNPIVALTASLKDLGDNLGTTSEVVVIETDEPTLIRINSTKADGIYGENTGTAGTESRYIDIFLEFNKSVKFFEGGINDLTPSTAPKLRLNNGGYAFYNGGNATNRFIFRYFIDGEIGNLNTAIINQGGTSTKNPDGSYYNLNVEEIISTTYPSSGWKSVQGGINVTIPDSVFDSDGGLMSLAGGKRLIIDNEAPKIKNITTGASASRNHGAGTQIYITVNFDEQIKVTGQTTGPGSNLYLTLKGGNLTNTTRANYSSIASSSSISFLYTVGATDDTSGYDPEQYLGVSGFLIGSGASVTDIAGNPLNTTLPFSGALQNSSGDSQNVVIDTKEPATPSISGISAQSYYGNSPTFIINGLEENATVQYNLNYTTNPNNWTNYSGSIISGSTIPIEIPLNGEYNIAVRQYDNAATNKNESAISTPVGPVKVDKGAILTRLTSSTPNGTYSYGVTGKNKITINMEFRIPLTLASGTAANAYLELNTGTGLGGDGNKANLKATPDNDSNVWKFEYNIPDGASAEPLKVTGINLDAIIIKDRSVGGTEVNEWIKLTDLEDSNTFESQKNITIVSGRPQVLNRDNLNSDIQFTGTQLTLKFDRDILRGNTANKLIIRQIQDNYQIPAVLTEQEFNDLFNGRSDIFEEQTDILTAIWSGSDAAGKAENWKKLGNALYQKGTNGADSALKSDTTVKYVLKFDVDPTAIDGDTTGITGLITGITNMGQLRTLFRAAEALSFGALAEEVSIENVQVAINGSNVLKPRQLKIDLNKSRKLSVKGASYQWIFPNGFIKDSLGSANGTGGGTDTNPTGNDTYLTSGDTTGGDRVLLNTGVEKPVIRIDKGSDIETFNNNTVNRQALQPLQSKVKINSRTPGATITYSKRDTTDNASKLIMRDNPMATGNQLPNRNNFTAWNSTAQATYKDYWDNVRMRPQSGTAGYEPPEGYGIDPVKWKANGQNWWTPMITTWPADSGYSSQIDIGTANYSDGGMIVHIRARAALAGTNSEYSYEAAYRSVFVYINQAVNTAGFNANGPDGTNLNGNALDRIWIRGSDNLYGNPTAPDFPISMDFTKWRKIRLLTPINATGLAADTTLTASNIPATVGTGKYLWFWVTWKINVPAFLNLYYGQLPATGDPFQDANDPTKDYQVPRSTREITLGSVGSKEHFAIIPGRTTAIETRDGAQNDNGNTGNQSLYRYRWYGHSGNLTVGTAITTPTKTD